MLGECSSRPDSQPRQEDRSPYRGRWGQPRKTGKMSAGGRGSLGVSRASSDGRGRKIRNGSFHLNKKTLRGKKKKKKAWGSRLGRNRHLSFAGQSCPIQSPKQQANVKSRLAGRTGVTAQRGREVVLGLRVSLCQHRIVPRPPSPEEAPQMALSFSHRLTSNAATQACLFLSKSRD